MPPEDWQPIFEGWMEEGLELRVRMAQKGLCVTHHAWFTRTIHADIQLIEQSG